MGACLSYTMTVKTDWLSIWRSNELESHWYINSTSGLTSHPAFSSVSEDNCAGCIKLPEKHENKMFMRIQCYRWVFPFCRVFHKTLLLLRFMLDFRTLEIWKQQLWAIRRGLFAFLSLPLSHTQENIGACITCFLSFSPPFKITFPVKCIYYSYCNLLYH